MRSACLLALWTAAALPQAADYNPIYRGEAGNVFTREPNAFLAAVARQRNPGKALDVGMGQGRNALFLARLGWDVTGFDPSDEGVRQARAEAARLGVRLRAEVAEIETFDFGEGRWDLIVLTYVPVKAAAPRIAAALRPGGAVVVEDRHIDTRRVWPAGTFDNNELLPLFPGLRVIRYEDVRARADWSPHAGEERLVRLAAEKPEAWRPGCEWEGADVEPGAKRCWGRVTFLCGRRGWEFTRTPCAP